MAVDYISPLRPIVIQSAIVIRRETVLGDGVTIEQEAYVISATPSHVFFVRRDEDRDVYTWDPTIFVMIFVVPNPAYDDEDWIP